MGWRLAQHNGFKRELSKLGAHDADAIRTALARLRDQLDRVGSLDPRKVFSSGAPGAGTASAGRYFALSDARVVSLAGPVCGWASLRSSFLTTSS